MTDDYVLTQKTLPGRSSETQMLPSRREGGTTSEGTHYLSYELENDCVAWAFDGSDDVAADADEF